MTSYRQIESLNDKILKLNKVGIIYNVQHESAIEVVEKLEHVIKSNGLETIIKKVIPGRTCQEQNFEKDVDLAIIVGGDGTFLGAARFYAPYGVPLFGINIGRLGFLSQLNPDNLEYGIQQILQGKFKIEERFMLKAYNEDESHNIEYTALNDIVIKSGSISRTAQLFLYINDKHVCDYIADGLIISTPTGSTAYTLSAGGPVVVSDLDAMVIVPICPHSLTSRPIVIPAKELISVKVESDTNKIYLTADGQENAKLKSNDIIHIKQSKHKAKLILLEKWNNAFYCILREKLHWGVTPGCDCQ